MSHYSVTVKYNFNSTIQFRNVHYYEFFNYVPTSTGLQELVDGIDSAYKSRLQTLISDDVTFTAYDVRRIDTGGLPSLEFTATAGTWSGTSTDHLLPTQVAALVSFKAQTTVPRNARTYIAGLTEVSNITDGLVSAALVTALGNWASDMLEITITEGLNADKQAVTIGGTPPAVTASNDVSTYTVAANWATQRRRRPGRGI